MEEESGRETFLSCAMAENKHPVPEVEISDNLKVSDAKRYSRNVKIATIGVLTVVLLLAAVISVAVYFTLMRKTPTRLAEVNLKEGETLTYRVRQDIQIQGEDIQKGILARIFINSLVLLSPFYSLFSLLLSSYISLI